MQVLTHHYFADPLKRTSASMIRLLEIFNGMYLPDINKYFSGKWGLSK